MAFTISLQADGLPLSHYGVYKGINIGDQYSVTAIAEIGLYYWNQFFAKPNEKVFLSYDWDHQWPINREALPKNVNEAKEKIIRCANHLVQVAEDRGSFAIWTYPYDFSYNTKAGWCSSQAQISSVQLLYRAFELSKNPAHLEMAKKGQVAFLVPVSQGGLLENMNDKAVWYEKFISPGNDNPKVLNGMMFVLLGLHDLHQKSKLNELKIHFEKGIQGLVAQLHKFDTGNWSAYDILGKAASDHYHDIHIEQLKSLFKMTRAPELKKYAKKFQDYKFKRKMRGFFDSIFGSKKSKKKKR